MVHDMSVFQRDFGASGHAISSIFTSIGLSTLEIYAFSAVSGLGPVWHDA